MNFNTVKAGAEWAKVNLEKKDPYMRRAHGQDRWPDHDRRQHRRGHRLDLRRRAVRRLVSDHTRFLPGRSPSTIICPSLRKREDGKHTYAVVQAEDELAAIGMTIGAGWSGLRSMTSTSGPGL